jgi:hypothetical protein
VPEHRADLVLGDDLVVHVQLRRPNTFAIFAHAVLDELDSDEVGGEASNLLASRA